MGSTRKYLNETKKLDNMIKTYIEKYEKAKANDKAEISDAFIIFRSMEGAARAIHAYDRKPI